MQKKTMFFCHYLYILTMDLLKGASRSFDLRSSLYHYCLRWRLWEYQRCDYFLERIQKVWKSDSYLSLVKLQEVFACHTKLNEQIISSDIWETFQSQSKTHLFVLHWRFGFYWGLTGCYSKTKCSTTWPCLILVLFFRLLFTFYLPIRVALHSV